MFQKSTLVTLYYSFIYPYLSYCIEVWGTAGVSHLSSLLKLQKRVVRIITFSAYRAHAHDLFTSLEILTLDKIYIYKVGLLMYKVNCKMIPVIIRDLFRKSSDVHQYCTRQNQGFYIPICKTTALYKTIRFKGVSIWNNIITQIDPCCSISTFKLRMKKYLNTD